MNAKKYLNQLVLVTLYDGSKHQGILKLSGIEFVTQRRYYEVHGGGEVHFVPIDDIASVKPAMLK